MANRLLQWLNRNDFRLLRFALAIVVFFVVTVPLARSWESLIKKDLKDFITVTMTVTQASPPVKAGGEVPSPSENQGKSDSQGKSDNQTNIKTDQTVESASPRVWVFGLQLAAWTMILGVSIWAVVALTRDE